MGVKSTYAIDRVTAINVILCKVINCTNEQLSNILLNFDESYYRNYEVYDKLPENETTHVIKTLSDFSDTL